MNAFKILLQLQGFPIKQALQTYSDLKLLSASGLAEYHETQRRAIVNYHRQHSRFYAAFEHGQNDWADIPFLNKRDIQLPLEEIITPEFSHTSVYRNNTSGSTGIPFHFAKDKFCHAMTWAFIYNRYQSIGLEYGKSLQARFFGIPLSKKKYLKEKLKDLVSSRVRFPVFDLSEKNMSEYLNRFYKYRFKYIYGYTSSLVLFANHVLGKGLTLKNVCPTLTHCIVTAEVCSQGDKDALQQAFGVKVYNEYGAAELGVIAFEDSDGDMLLNEENLFIEVLDENGKEIEPGAEGEVVITCLYNRAMPFVRYRLGDRIILKKYKKNGRRVVDAIKGRVNDVALLPSGKKSPGLTFYYVSKSMLENSGVIKEFIIKQIKADEFLFEYVATKELTMLQCEQVQQLMDQYLEPGLRPVFLRVDKIERTAAGKFKHFQYLV